MLHTPRTFPFKRSRSTNANSLPSGDGDIVSKLMPEPTLTIGRNMPLWPDVLEGDRFVAVIANIKAKASLLTDFRVRGRQIEVSSLCYLVDEINAASGVSVPVVYYTRVPPTAVPSLLRYPVLARTINVFDISDMSIAVIWSSPLLTIPSPIGPLNPWLKDYNCTFLGVLTSRIPSTVCILSPKLGVTFADIP